MHYKNPEVSVFIESQGNVRGRLGDGYQAIFILKQPLAVGVADA